MSLSEVNDGKKSDDADVEEIQDEVAKVDAEDKPARSERGQVSIEVTKVFFWPRAYSCKYFSPCTSECGFPVGGLPCSHVCGWGFKTILISCLCYIGFAGANPRHYARGRHMMHGYL